MKKLGYVLLLVSNCIFAQITFEKGYYVDNAGQKIECLIKNEDWKNNPSSFYFKKNEGTSENFGSIANVKEFAIDNFSKYERYEVLMDTSEVDVAKLSSNKNPQWSKKTLFLKLIVDGDAKLYEYTNGIQRRYFYSFKGSNVEQLVYKEYYKQDNQILLENKYFHQQLWNNVKCSTTKKTRISRIGYKSSDLIKYFLEVNNCDGNKAITNESDIKKTSGFTNFKVKAGVNSSKLEINSHNESLYYPVQFENKTGIKVGLEVEQVLGFNKNKWAIFYEPSFQSYSSETTKDIDFTSIVYRYNWKVKYSYLDHYAGIKHYMFLNENAKFFISGGIIYKQVIGKSELESEREIGGDHREYELGSRISLGAGLGFSYKKANLELRYTRPDIMNQYRGLYTKFNTISLVFGYNIFDLKKNK
jgi:hypothetical protein